MCKNLYDLKNLNHKMKTVEKQLMLWNETLQLKAHENFIKAEICKNYPKTIRK